MRKMWVVAIALFLVGCSKEDGQISRLQEQEQKEQEQKPETALIDSPVLPGNLLETSTIENMAVGSAGYVTYWSMHVRGDRKCFLRKNALVDALSSGTEMTTMRVERHEDGYHVYASQVGQKWLALDLDGELECHQSNFFDSMIPVARIH